MFNFFKRNKKEIDWDLIKSQDPNTVYPKNSISLLMGQTENSNPTTGWVDLGYKPYEYKKQCPININLTIDILSDEDQTIDMGFIEDLLTDSLREKCVAHPISRVSTDSGLVMDYYVDNLENAKNILSDISDSKKNKLKIDYNTNLDPKWKTYRNIARAVR
ncbi:MAG: hypothetical protein COB15_09380 [Flavobacteriales bacterium]|nr:MAG: hypothetical protein COB15_09380 [Flavobacteriales bacterium]